jgi:hypothetical protein
VQQDDEPASPRPPAPSRPAGPADRPGGGVTTGRAARLVQRVHPATWPVSLGALGVLGLVLLHLVDPNEPGNYPTCPWLLLTGTFCPGCGTMRAVALLTHLDVSGALAMNPLLVLLLPYLALTYLTWLAGTLRPRARPPRPAPTWFVWTILVSFVVFWIARNLPWFSFLAPGTPLLPSW